MHILDMTKKPVFQLCLTNQLNQNNTYLDSGNAYKQASVKQIRYIVYYDFEEASQWCYRPNRCPTSGKKTPNVFDYMEQ